ncbi:ribosomal protein L1 [Candidatus Riesia pediculicola USDA]|uniref:Large ribosomal subunit protein uL1 n=2 Tax=Candidatus Riesia pediculicola TaxID=401619 RepID=D4G8J6_RIEPU|nr:ribosomal protein L1 [Candidatus Riesia pediculicola USDA]ARC53875.1 50S ribosomal protein L1 [Candidatus Riesia pediculicola]
MKYMKSKNKMKDLSKNARNIKKKYSLNEAIKFLKNQKKAKFIESVDVAVQLAIDVKKMEQNIRGSFAFPNGFEKKRKIAVFTSGRSAEKAKILGIKLIGMEDLAEKLVRKKNKFDLVIASVESMKIVKKVSHIIGPRGLMPSLKTGTITEDIESCIKEVQNGKAFYQNDKNGIVHSSVGKIDLDEKKIEENIRFFLKHLIRSKPISAKGAYIKKLHISTTMGKSVEIDLSNLSC